ncbi:hypothetical protein AB6U14_03210 [Klebsiella pneumoniae]
MAISTSQQTHKTAIQTGSGNPSRSSLPKLVISINRLSEFTFSFVKPQTNGGSFHSYRTRMCITETQEGLAFSAAGRQVSVSKKPTKEMLSEVIALAVESGLLYSQ